MREDRLPPLPAALTAKRITLRAERSGDRTFLRALYGEHRARELAAVPWPEAIKASFLDDQFRLQSSHYAEHPSAERRILVRGARAIGRIYLDRSGASWSLLEIGLLAREQRHGLGSALVGWVQRAAADAGAGVGLHVARDNLAAARFYQRLGFRFAESPSPTHLRMEWSG